MNLNYPYTEGDTLKNAQGEDFLLFGLPYTQLVYVAAKGKTFTMGDNNSGYDDEKETLITFDHDYFIGRFAVTQELYEHIIGNNPSSFKGKYRPVETVSWDEITQVFLPQLNQKVQGMGIPGRFALPSEAQWEYAAAGGQAWNSPRLAYAGSNNVHDVAWFTENSDDKTTFPVGLKQPNALGLYDMSGNVWEWCQDDYQASLAQLPKNGSFSPNTKNASKVLRGGSYYNGRINCRVCFRSNHPARHPSQHLRVSGGFFPQFRPDESMKREEGRRTA